MRISRGALLTSSFWLITKNYYKIGPVDLNLCFKFCYFTVSAAVGYLFRALVSNVQRILLNITRTTYSSSYSSSVLVCSLLFSPESSLPRSFSLSSSPLLFRLDTNFFFSTPQIQPPQRN